MKRNTDPHYYDCSHPDRHGGTVCAGQMQYFGPDSQKQAVYKCSICRRLSGESGLKSAHDEMKRRD